MNNARFHKHLRLGKQSRDDENGCRFLPGHEIKSFIIVTNSCIPGLIEKNFNKLLTLCHTLVKLRVVFKNGSRHWE